MERENKIIYFNNQPYKIINKIVYNNLNYYLIINDKIPFKYKIVYNYLGELYQVINDSNYKEIMDKLFNN